MQYTINYYYIFCDDNNINAIDTIGYLSIIPSVIPSITEINNTGDGKKKDDNDKEKSNDNIDNVDLLYTEYNYIGVCFMLDIINYDYKMCDKNDKKKEKVILIIEY